MLSHEQLFATIQTEACQAPLSMEFSSKNTAVGCHALLQGVFLTQGWNLGLLLGKWILYRLSHQGHPQEISLLTLNQFRQLGLTGHTQAQGQLGNNLKVLKTMKLTQQKS